MTPGSIRRRDLFALLGSAIGGATLLAACGGTAAVATSSGSVSASAQASTAAASSPAATTSQAAAMASSNATPNPLKDVPVKAGKTAIDWWFGWGGMTALGTFANLATTFNKNHDDFQVKPLQVSDISTKLQAAIAGGNPPAVETGNINFAQFWVSGAATPLDAYIQKSKVINPTDIFEANLAAGKWKGKTYGVPAVEAFLRWGLCLNKALLDKNGLKADNLPTDFDTMYQWAKQMTVVESSGAIKVLGFDPLDAMGGSFGDGDPFFWPAAYNFKYYDEGTGQYNFNNDMMIESFTWIQKFYDITGADKIAGFTKAYGTWTESPTAMFPSGVEGANINGYWAPGELAKSSPNNEFVYGWVPTPSSNKGVKLQSTGGHYGMLPKGSTNNDQGFALIEWLNTDEAMQIIFDGTGWLGASKKFLAKVDVSKYKGLDFFIKSATEANPMWSVLVDPVQAYVSDQWSKLQDQVNYHKMEPKNAAAQLQDAATQELKNRFPNGV